VCRLQFAIECYVVEDLAGCVDCSLLLSAMLWITAKMCCVYHEL